jgi:hypothetical protein
MNMLKMLVAAAFIAMSAITACNPALARTNHYACKSGEERYALTVNEDKRVVKLILHGPPFTATTFRILKGTSDYCKYAWALSDGASICTATQGVATLNWFGREFECDQADTE